MKKNITVADWMSERGIVYITDAEKYTIGQDLTNEEVQEIKLFLWHSIAYDAGLDGLGDMIQFLGDDFKFKFHHFLMTLIWDPRVPEESNWSDILWDSIEPEERSICHQIMRDMQPTDFTEDDDE